MTIAGVLRLAWRDRQIRVQSYGPVRILVAEVRLALARPLSIQLGFRHGLGNRADREAKLLSDRMLVMA